MINSKPRWTLRVVHTPTGITVLRSSNIFRSQHHARDSAIRYLRSRLYMLGYGGTIEEEIRIEEIGDEIHKE